MGFPLRFSTALTRTCITLNLHESYAPDRPHLPSNKQSVPTSPPLIPPSPTQPTNGSVPPTSTVTKRRRISGATSRGVSNLTPEQLQKKRANDREAQRAIRERTRNQIETLEKRIQELTSQDPFVDLQDVVREKELVAAENEELKRKLSSIANLAQQSFPIANVLNQPAEVTLPPFSTTATAPLTIPSPATVFNEPISVRSSASTGSNYSASPSTTKHTPPIPQPNFLPGMLPQLNAFGLRNRPIDDKMGIDAVMSRSRHNSREHQMQQRARSGSVTAEVLPQDPLAVRTVGLDARGVALPPYAMPPRNTVTSCPLDTLFLDFLSDNRRQAMSGIPIAELAGPPNPSFISLIEPNPRSTAHPLSRVFTDMLHTFPSIDTRPEQVAILHVMFLFMRWQVHPTQENYDRLPEWYTPRPSALFIEHPMWVDYLPWPHMRERMISGGVHQNTPFDEFFIPYTTTVSLNWPFSPDDILLRHSDPATETTVLSLNPRFEEHLYNLSNWSLGPAFAKAHPRLADTARIADSRRPN